MIYYFLTVTLLFFVRLLVGFACPENVHRELFICMSNLTTGIHEDGRKLGEDAYIYRRICRTREFRSAITCVKSLFHQCRDMTEHLRLLKRLADPENINEAFKVMCDNMNLYEDSSGCLITQNDRITSCIRHSEKAFDKESNSSFSVDQQIDAFCGFQRGMRNCVVVPVKEVCGQDIGNLLSNFMKGITAPACNAVGNTIHVSIFKLLFLLIAFYLLTQT